MNTVRIFLLALTLPCMASQALAQPGGGGMNCANNAFNAKASADIEAQEAFQNKDAYLNEPGPEALLDAMDNCPGFQQSAKIIVWGELDTMEAWVDYAEAEMASAQANYTAASQLMLGCATCIPPIAPDYCSAAALFSDAATHYANAEFGWWKARDKLISLKAMIESWLTLYGCN